MKVWELMAELAKVPAGLEVKVSVCSTLEVEIEEVDVDDERVHLQGGDVELVNTSGDIMGYLSELSDAENE